jgi:hypothetical protein
MTRTEDRLTDALGATARALREDTLRPLAAPDRRRRRPAWIAPVAAVASVLLVVGLGIAVTGQLPGSGQAGGAPAVAALPRYYVEAGYSGTTVVRSTATGAVTARVPYPRPNPELTGLPTVAAARNGTFFLATLVRGSNQERIFQFRLTGSGKVSGFAQVPGSIISEAGTNVDAMASSPDGSQLAISVGLNGGQSDQITVINVATGAKSVWRGGMGGLGLFTVASLSWTGNGRELVVLGQWCKTAVFDNETCGSGPGRTAEVWALDPASGGGQLDHGHLLLRQSARYPFIAQAVISPDGSMITSVVLTGPATGIVPRDVSVRQISVATKRQLGVLYRRRLPVLDSSLRAPDFLALSQDGAGQHWMLSCGLGLKPPDREGFNGRIDGGQLMPLPPRFGTEVSEAW